MGKNKFSVTIIYILSFIISVVVYFKSFFHLPRADHWNVIMHTFGTTDLLGIIKKSYSYARQSLIAPGDVVLFRPVQSSWLAIEKYLFGPTSHWPQIISFILHVSIFVLINYLLSLWFKLIDKKNKTNLRLFLPIITVFFFLNFSIVELAIWASLKGYLLFIVLVLSGLIFLTKVVSEPKSLNLKYLFFAWILFLISAFTYEFGQFVCLIVCFVFGLLLLKLGNKKGAFLTASSFALIFLIYRWINFLDYNLYLDNISYMRKLGVPTGENVYSYSYMLKSFFSLSTLKNFLNILYYTIINPFFPLNTNLHAADKVYLAHANPFRHGFLAIPSSMLIVSWFYFSINGAIEGFKSKNIYFKYFFVLLCLIFFAYLSIAVLGRMNLRADYSDLESYSYYIYLGFVFFTLLSALAIYFYFQNIITFSKIKKSLFAFFVTNIALVTVMSTFIVGKINREIFQYQSYLRNIVGQIEDFVDKNEIDSKLKFAFDLENSDYMPMAPGIGLPKAYLLLHNHMNEDNPDYRIVVKDKKVNFYTKGEYSKLYGKNRYMVLKVTKVVSPYKIYEYKHIYYGVPYWHLTYDPLVDKDDLVLKDKNIGKVISGIPLKMSELNSRIERGEIKHPFDYDTHLINKDYKGFSVTKHLYWFFAIPKESGDFSLESIDRDLYTQWFSARSLKSIYKMIDSFTKLSKIWATNFNEADLFTCLVDDFGYESWVAKGLRI